jgi:hypothetical protein
VNSLAFLYTKAIPVEVLREHTVASLSHEAKIALMDRAVSRFRGKQREMLVTAKAQFVELLRGDG